MIVEVYQWGNFDCLVYVEYKVRTSKLERRWRTDWTKQWSRWDLVKGKDFLRMLPKQLRAVAAAIEEGWSEDTDRLIEEEVAEK